MDGEVFFYGVTKFILEVMLGVYQGVSASSHRLS